MSDYSATTNMSSWSRQGWSIVPGHTIRILGIQPPPPSAARDLIEARSPFASLPGIGAELADVEAYEELLEDLAVARHAIAQYEHSGIARTSPYDEYRAKRLESGS